ncbi:acyl carrier protein [bacterium 1xD8-48]|jgi:D-alanine--poly(phosphoribitol) ligase subunit 2|nr:acyl carrier protein [Lachnospiraceae bacterium]NBJ97569.1 acyl carrier protein [bacterium 1xD8-48]
MREKLLEVLADAKPGFEFEGKTGLIDEGYLDSFDIITLVTELNEKFDIDIPVEDIVAENFDSVDTILALIGRLNGE